MPWSKLLIHRQVKVGHRTRVLMLNHTDLHGNYDTNTQLELKSSLTYGSSQKKGEQAAAELGQAQHQLN